MPSSDPVIKKAYKDGVITKGQYEKLSDGLLKGIIKKKKAGGGTKKGEVRKTARKAYEPKKKGSCPCPKCECPKKKGGVKEERKKLGKETHKRGRPKGGSKVEIVK